jgi:3-methylcrotonyl-CoA carboxylase alpha subunit
MNERLRTGDTVIEVVALPGADGAWRVLLDGVEHSVERAELRGGELSFTLSGQTYLMHVHVTPETSLVADGHAVHRFTRVEEGAPEAAESAGGELISQMPGKVLALLAAVGERVAQGQALLILEAMKMEHEVCAPADGVVRGYPRQIGERVMPGDLLVEFDPVVL